MVGKKKKGVAKCLIKNVTKINKKLIFHVKMTVK